MSPQRPALNQHHSGSVSRDHFTYHWHTGRSHQCLKDILPDDYQGTIQSDGYQAYQTFLKQHPVALKSAACWAHVRRKFHDALQGGDHPGRTSWILRQIQHLYRIERHLRESRAGPNLRQAVRQHQSQAIIQRIHRALLRLQTSRQHLPKSLLGQAITYALGQWPGLGVYVNNGLVEIDILPRIKFCEKERWFFLANLLYHGRPK